MQSPTKLRRYSLGGNKEEWGGIGAIMDDPEEQRVLFAALDSF